MKIKILYISFVFCFWGNLFSQKTISEELSVPGHNLYVNRINAALADFPNITGKNITVSIKENAFDAGDIDYQGRFIANSRSNKTLTTHAGIIATLLCGAGNTTSKGKGVASGSNLLSTGFNNLFPEPIAYFDSFNITVQNHSYGSGIENFYGAEALAYDNLTTLRPNTLIVFSAGNSGLLTPTDGKYANLGQYANITGNFKEAKNNLVVGSVDSFGAPEIFSSHGPAYDGRLKPEIVAFGNDGTSGAAALVSGAAALVQQFIIDKLKSQIPYASLVKAILINSADDVGAEGIDFITGFGNLNTLRALQTVDNARFYEGVVENGKKWSTPLSVPKNSAELKLTLVWNDTTKTQNTSIALLNDLDLELENTQTGEIILPWVLNSFPNIDSLKQLPQRKRDSLNNIEQISVKNPLAGNYSVRVIAKKTVSPQLFHIAYQIDSVEYFTWTFPKRNDNVSRAQNTVLRWSTNFKNTKAILKYKEIGAKTWSVVDSFSNIESLFRIWQTPNSLKLAQLAIEIGAKTFLSDTFFISQDAHLKVGFNCADSVGIFWNKLQDSILYQIYFLGEKYLEPLKVNSDTFFVFSKKNVSTPFITVAPILKNFIGIKSPTLDYNLQGVGCYAETFYAEHLYDNTVDLMFRIGTLYNLKKITIERYENSKFQTFKDVLISGLAYELIDAQPLNGLNTYRLRFETQSGQSFNSIEVSVFILNASDFTLFPNPVPKNSTLTVLSKVQNENAEIKIFDIFGRLMYEKILNDFQETLILPANLSKGLYVYKIEKLGKLFASGKVLIL